MENDKKQNLLENGIFPFDPIVLLRDVAKRWMLILLVVVFVGTCAYVSADISYEPIYQTTITFVVTNRSSNSTVYSNLSSATSLAQVFTELLNSYLLRDTIMSEVGDVGFDGTIKAAMINETNLLTVTVSASSPRASYLVSKAIIEHHEDLTYQVIDNVSLEVLQWPTVPTAPSNYNNASGQMRKRMVQAFLAMVALLAYASFARDTVRSVNEARTKLDCDYLGEIAHEKQYKTVMSFLRRSKIDLLISDPGISFNFVETFRKLCHRIEQRMHGRKILLVTSTMASEGKSTVAVNMALSMARNKKKVLYIDCDLYKPTGHKLLQLDHDSGSILDCLIQNKTPEKAVIYDKKRNLHVLLGKTCAEASMILSGSAMQDLLAWARDTFDLVVLDMPPMEATPDTEAIMEFVDASVLIVRQAVASTRLINKNIAILNSGKAKLLGCIVNNVYSSILSSNEGYGYGRYGGYGRYSKYGKYGHYGHYRYYDRYTKKDQQDQ